jgi:hypothetical protein
LKGLLDQLLLEEYKIFFREGTKGLGERVGVMIESDDKISPEYFVNTKRSLKSEIAYLENTKYAREHVKRLPESDLIEFVNGACIKNKPKEKKGFYISVLQYVLESFEYEGSRLPKDEKSLERLLFDIVEENKYHPCLNEEDVKYLRQAWGKITTEWIEESEEDASIIDLDPNITLNGTTYGSSILLLNAIIDLVGAKRSNAKGAITKIIGKSLGKGLKPGYEDCRHTSSGNGASSCTLIVNGSNIVAIGYHLTGNKYHLSWKEDHAKSGDTKGNVSC